MLSPLLGRVIRHFSNDSTEGESCQQVSREMFSAVGLCSVLDLLVQKPSFRYTIGARLVLYLNPPTSRERPQVTEHQSLRAAYPVRVSLPLSMGKRPFVIQRGQKAEAEKGKSLFFFFFVFFYITFYSFFPNCPLLRTLDTKRYLCYHYPVDLGISTNGAKSSTDKRLQPSGSCRQPTSSLSPAYQPGHSEQASITTNIRKDRISYESNI